LYQNGVVAYDVENRVAEANGVKYAYSPDNLRIWRGSTSLDELTVYSMGQKLGAYNLSVNNGALVATCTGYYQYFGGKVIKNATGYVGQDRLGSVGKYFPYGQDRSGTPANGSEKFATYTRDAETGLDYADQRYHSGGDGRFLTPDPFGGSAKPMDPSSWNRYTYTGGDPVNRNDPGGRDWACVGFGGSLDYCEYFTSGTEFFGYGIGVGMSNCGNNFIEAGDYVFANCFAYSHADACSMLGYCQPEPCGFGLTRFSYGCDSPLGIAATQIFAEINLRNPGGMVTAFALLVGADAGYGILLQAIGAGVIAADGATLTGTVWDLIVGTQEVYAGTVLPQSLTISAGGGNFWIHANATKHIAEWALANLARGVSQSLVNVGTQQLLASLQAAMAEAYSLGITYGTSMTVGGWELTFGPAAAEGMLPVLYHAVPLL
jgi:RHS repeat-associated protein